MASPFPAGFGFTLHGVDPQSRSAAQHLSDAARAGRDCRPSCRSAPRRRSRGSRSSRSARTGAQMVLANTYHLALRPGREIVAELGRAARLHGLGRADPHRQRRLSGLQPGRDDQGPRSRAPSSARTSTAACSSSRPNGPSQIQEALGSDVAMVLDHVVALPNKPEVIARRHASGTDPLGAALPAGGPPARSGPVRHRAGGPGSGLAANLHRAARGARFSRLRRGRAERRRNAGRDVPHARRHGPASAGRPAALSDGRRPAAKTCSKPCAAASTCSTA